jgi:nucleotide-binding universal stress UspA family protein
MKKILFATDGSDYSKHAAELLSRLPHAGKLDIIVVSIVNTPRVYADGSQAQWLQDYVQEQQDQARTSFEDIRRLFEGANADLTHVVDKGAVGATLVQLAAEHQVNMVVMGARGHANVERILLGSTSDYVATHAPCSVLIVRPSTASDQDEHMRIAIGFEDSGPAQAAIEEFAEVQWGSKSNVQIVTVVQPLVEFGGDIDPDIEAQAKVIETMRRAASDLKDSCVRVQTKIIDHRHVGEGLVRFAEENLCTMVVVGETPRSTIGRLLMGSVSRYVLRHAPCSVWITRNRLIHSHGNKSKRSAQAT